MGYWNSRGLRGAGLEEIVNFTNERFMEKGLGVMQKIPTPITPVNFDNSTRTITLAYFEKQSTVDYIGAVQGIPLCFDAKETAAHNLPIQNIHEHQVNFMTAFEKQGGVAFFLVYFRETDEYFYLPLKEFLPYWQESKNGGRKSIAYEKFRRDLIIEYKNGILDYLEAMNTYLVSG